MNIETTDLVHRFTNNHQIEFPDIGLANGESALVLGDSGVGKTTLLHILGGLLKPSNGEVKIIGNLVYQMHASKLDKFRGQHLGIVFQKPHFMSSLTARENLELALTVSGLQQQRLAINEISETLGIAHRLGSKVNQMSQGELQRLSIARACLKKPKLLLADEPTSALDDRNTDEVIKVLKAMQAATQATLLIVTHDARLKSSFDNVIQLKSS